MGNDYVWTGISGVLAVLAILASLKSWRKKWEVDDTPTSTCRGVFVGRNEVTGRVVPTHQPLAAPFSGLACVWFEWHLERYRSDDDGGSWVTVERRATAAPFWLEDDTGRILVRPRGADLDPEQTVHNTLGRDYAPPYSRWQLRQWVLVGEDVVERQRSLADPGFWEPPTASTFFRQGTGDAISALRGKNRITERVLRAGQPVYVLADARPRSDGPGLELCAEAGPLMLTTKGEEEVAEGEGSNARWQAFWAAALTVLFTSLLSNIVTGDLHWTWPVATVAAEAAFFFLVALVRNYNRQVTVKQQAAKAWSMIDVSLRRRADLLPSLARVAEGYARHEQATQQSLAQLRSDPGLPPEEELPAESTLVTAEASDRGQRSAAAGAFALAEGYPDLKADAVFLDLQRRITEAEEAVASARHFYNDAINVLRDRRQQLPGSLFARMVPVPSWRLFEADEADRDVPDLALAPALAPDVAEDRPPSTGSAF
ncbi:hypothetical protein BH10ACT1_BH10ACT1_04690 [soil metagenome]